MFIILLLYVGVSDATSDDYSMQLAMFDNSNIYLNWSTIFWSYPIHILQILFPKFAWHYLSQIILICISLNIYLIVIRRRFDYINSNILIIIFTIFSFYTMVSALNFTKTSAYIIGTGCSLIYLYNDSKHKEQKYIQVIAGVFLIFAGVQLRFDVFYIFLGLFLLMCICTFIDKRRNDARKLIIILLTILMCCSAKIIDTRIKKCNEEFNLYTKYNARLANIVDYQIKTFEEAKDAYSKLGLNENDVNFLVRKCESDPEVFNYDLLIALGNTISYKWSLDNIFKNELQTIKSLVKTLFGNSLEWFCYFMLILMFVENRKENNRKLLVSILMILSYSILFAYMGRIVERTMFAVVILSIMPMLLITKVNQNKYDFNISNMINKLLSVTIALVCIFNISTIKNRRHLTSINNNDQKLCEYISNDEKYFYAYSVGLKQAYKSVENLLLTKYYYHDDNIFYLNNSRLDPIEKEKFNTYVVLNVYKDSINSKIIRFVLDDKDLELIENYIIDHYNKNAMLLKENTIYGYNIYRVIELKN